MSPGVIHERKKMPINWRMIEHIIVEQYNGNYFNRRNYRKEWFQENRRGLHVRNNTAKLNSKQCNDWQKLERTDDEECSQLPDGEVMDSSCRIHWS